MDDGLKFESIMSFNFLAIISGHGVTYLMDKGLHPGPLEVTVF